MNTQTTYLASKPHYEILDGLRGVAAVMVVAFHLLDVVCELLFLLLLDIVELCDCSCVNAVIELFKK